jgi:hypothetical protein
MHAAAGVADEWALKMDSEWDGAILAIGILSCGRMFMLVFAIALTFFDCIGQAFERPQSRIHGGGDGGGEITRDAVPGQQLFDCRERLGAFVHDVVSGAAMNVKIDETRRHHVIAEIEERDSSGNIAAALSGNFENASLLDEHEGMLDGLSRGQKPCGSKSQHRNVLMAVKRRL